MEIYKSKEKITQNTVAVLGFFDGLHLGHAALIEKAKEVAAKRGLKVLLYTFGSMPDRKGVTGELTPFKLKAALARDMGVDIMVADPFDDQIRATEPEQFVKGILKERLSAHALVCGFHYRFGANAGGDAPLLSTLGSKLGLETFVIEPVMLDGELISSSRIRELIAKGDVSSAARLMGRPYAVCGTVIEGKRLGRTIGFPTINQRIDPHMTPPMLGVYLSRVILDGGERFGVSNIGRRPTVGDFNEINIETHIFDFSGDLYGKSPVVWLVDFIRPERRFDSIEALREQIEKDADEARRRAGFWDEVGEKSPDLVFTLKKICDNII